MTRRVRWVLIALAFLLIVVAVAFAHPRLSNSSLQLFADTNCACGDYQEDLSGIVILNPFRDRAPEDSATRFLSDLKNSKCAATDPALCTYALHTARPVLDWKLVNRRDTSELTSLFYRLKGKYREGTDLTPGDAWGEAMLQVQHRDARLQVVSFDVYY
jgi:hypothetical protein